MNVILEKKDISTAVCDYLEKILNKKIDRDNLDIQFRNSNTTIECLGINELVEKKEKK